MLPSCVHMQEGKMSAGRSDYGAGVGVLKMDEPDHLRRRCSYAPMERAMEH